MAKLADALDLGSSSERSEGSSPFIRTCDFAIAHLLDDIKWMISNLKTIICYGDCCDRLSYLF